MDSTNKNEIEMPVLEYDKMYQVEDKLWWYKGMRHVLRGLLTKYWDWSNIPHPKILDAGCGTGANLEHLLNGFYGKLDTRQAIGIDISQKGIDYCHRRGLENHAFLGSITNIPFDPDHFDIVISYDVLSCVPNDQDGFNEIARVLKPNGLAVINVAAYPWLYSGHDVASNVQRRYNKKELIEKLSLANFHIERITHVNFFLFPIAVLIRLLKKRALSHNATTAIKQSQVRSDINLPPKGINKILTKILLLEASLLNTNLDLPFGLSLLVLARKG